MPRKIAFTMMGLVDRLGEPRLIDKRGRWWRAMDLAVALNCTEQTIMSWSRQGRIPPGSMTGAIRFFSEHDVETLASHGVQKISHYVPITKGERKRLTRAGRPVPRALRTAKKGGAK